MRVLQKKIILAFRKRKKQEELKYFKALLTYTCLKIYDRKKRGRSKKGKGEEGREGMSVEGKGDKGEEIKF